MTMFNPYEDSFPSDVTIKHAAERFGLEHSPALRGGERLT
jgi:hypothetical protein